VCHRAEVDVADNRDICFTLLRAFWIPVRQSFNTLTPNDLKKRRTVSPLKIKIPSKNMREKPTNTPIIHSVY
jgi:hypothetical protein